MIPQAVEQLCELLSMECALAQRFYEVLAQEQLALERSDTAAIQALAKEKSRLVAAIDEQAGQRERLTGGRSFTQLRANCPASQQATLGEWLDRTAQLLTRCREQNDLNGRIIAATRRSVERALSLMRGQQPDAVLYTASGAAQRMQLRQAYVSV